MAEDLIKLESRVHDVEKRLNIVEKDNAVVKVEFLSVKSDLREIKDSLSWVTRLIIGALILAVLAFVFGGGLVLV